MEQRARSDERLRQRARPGQVTLGTRGPAHTISDFSRAGPFERLLVAPRSVCFQSLLLSCWEEHVVQDQSVPRRVWVQIEIGWFIADLMLRILGVVSAQESPGALAEGTVHVLGPGGAFFLTQNDHAGLEAVSAERRRQTVEIRQ